ncbi:MAG: hypothetical protein NZV14_19650 [Bryobacteraceae bacterium]|nr:hypothetical protein [Bryobacteraceae bacterium]MDW8380380.1 hypothetical protein [Bryobacterales bacterium]
MRAEEKLNRIFALLLEAVKRDPQLASEIEQEFGQAIAPPRPASSRRKQRNPAAFDPFSVFADGETALRTKLKELDVKGLKDMVAEYGMDPANRVRRWRKPDRILEHIVEMVKTRSRKGDAFRA